MRVAERVGQRVERNGGTGKGAFSNGQLGDRCWNSTRRWLDNGCVQNNVQQRTNGADKLGVGAGVRLGANGAEVGEQIMNIMALRYGVTNSNRRCRLTGAKDVPPHSGTEHMNY